MRSTLLQVDNIGVDILGVGIVRVAKVIIIPCVMSRECDIPEFVHIMPK